MCLKWQSICQLMIHTISNTLKSDIRWSSYVLRGIIWKEINTPYAFLEENGTSQHRYVSVSRQSHLKATNININNQPTSTYSNAGKVCHAPVLTPHCYYQPKYKASWYPGQQVKFYCPYGYKLAGHPYASCGYDGKWSNPAPICKSKTHIAIPDSSTSYNRI